MRNVERERQKRPQKCRNLIRCEVTAREMLIVVCAALGIHGRLAAITRPLCGVINEMARPRPPFIIQRD